MRRLGFVAEFLSLGEVVATSVCNLVAMLFLVIGKTKVHQSGDIISLSTDLREYIAACFTAIWIQSHEHEDALAEIAQLCRDENWRLATWDVAQGLQIAGQSDEADSTGRYSFLSSSEGSNKLSV